MTLSALEILAKEALLPAEHHHVLGSDQLFMKRQYSFLDAANPQTILDMIALIREQNIFLKEAIASRVEMWRNDTLEGIDDDAISDESIVHADYYAKKWVKALDAYEEFNK